MAATLIALVLRYAMVWDELAQLFIVKLGGKRRAVVPDCNKIEIPPPNESTEEKDDEKIQEVIQKDEQVITEPTKYANIARYVICFIYCISFFALALALLR